MGRWRITIDGVGCHHNGKRDIDADLAAKDFVDELKRQGHTLEQAKMEALGTRVDGEWKDDATDPTSGMNIDFLAAQPAQEAGTVNT